MIGDQNLSLTGTGPHTRVSWIRNGRLNVEIRVLAILAFLWCSGLLACAVWTVAVYSLGSIPEVPWLELMAPALLGGMAVQLLALGRLPSPRWPRRGPQPPSVVPLLLPGVLALPFVPYLVWRHRRAATREVDPAEAELAFRQLLRLPRAVGFGFAGWSFIAAAASGLIFAAQLKVPAATAAGLAFVWWMVAVPLSVIAARRVRAMLRSEYLSAPRPQPDVFPFHESLQLRLGAPALGLGAAAALGPILAAWIAAHHDIGKEARIRAQMEASRLLTVAMQRDSSEIGRVLATDPDITIVLADRTYGRSRALPSGHGEFDEDGDGLHDFFVARRGNTIVAVPIDGSVAVGPEYFTLAAAMLLVTGLISFALVTRDVSRDVRRATQQVASVARGDVPETIHEESFSTHELRQLVQSTHRLVTRITETNVSKYVVIERAQEADRLKSQFLANMSHDLRSPLNSILGFSELLLAGIEGELSEEQRDMISDIHASGRDLLQQIDDILDTAKIEAGRMEIHAEPTPPATLVSRAIQNARRRQGDRITFVTDTSPGLAPAFVDPYRSVQAIENVLIFAAERMTTGTISISVSSTHSEEAGREILVRVTTPMRPADAEQLARVRRGFVRIPGHRGLGLSLPIAGSILELEGGGLGIEGAGEGMIFVLRMPAPEARRKLRLREL